MRVIPGEANPIWENLRKNIGMIGSTVIQQQLAEQKRKKELQDAITLYKEKMKAKKEYGMTQPTISITETEYPPSEINKAVEVLSRTPQEWLRANMGKKTGGGFLGFGAKIELSDEAKKAVEKSLQILGGKKRTTRISTKGYATGTETPASLPDANLYQEGTTVDLDGRVFKVENGEWVEQ